MQHFHRFWGGYKKYMDRCTKLGIIYRGVPNVRRLDNNFCGIARNGQVCFFFASYASPELQNVFCKLEECSTHLETVSKIRLPASALVKTLA